MEYGNHHHAVPREENDCSERSRPIRWSPKEEQVEILESIYNSGVINPPKDETTRITTLLQYYGPVVDANVFYWFQNRRSRSRRRHRQIMAAAANIINSSREEQILIGQDQQQPPPAAGSPNYYYTTTGQQLISHPTPNSGEQNLLSPSITFLHDDSAAAYSSSSSTPAINENICCSYPAQVCNLDIQRNSDQVSPDVAYNTTCPGAGCTLNVHYDQSAAGFISVYINGAATVVPMGPLDMKRMFGEEDFILIHSTSGMLVSNTSISSSLAHGESYFLVPAST